MSRVAWLAPSPLWGDLSGGTDFRRPAVLRFATDTFMQDFQDALASRPASVRGFVAREETWRKPAAGLPPRTAAAPAAVPAGEVLKLYQPVHGRFYLVTASLGCRVPGLPEHTVDLASGETVSFVLRRLATDEATGARTEMAWVKGEAAHGWTAAETAAPLDAEERLPMFGTFFEADGVKRRIFAGLIPVDRREQYVGGRDVTPAEADDAAPSLASPSSPAAVAPVSTEDARVLEFQRSVLDPWVGLRDWYAIETASVTDWTRVNAARTAAEQASALVLLDLATFVRLELPAVWSAFATPALAASLPAAQRAFHDAFTFSLWNRTAAGTGAVSSTFRQALLDADDSREELENATLTVGVPPSFPAGYAPRLVTVDPAIDPGLTTVALYPLATRDAIAADKGKLNTLLDRDASLPEDVPGVHRRPIVQKLMNALDEVDVAAEASGGAPAAAGEPQRPPTMAPLNAQGDDAYVVRCVYARPRCGKRSLPVVSDASAEFRLAGFFDADAPQRAIRVAMPVDTSPAALRKYDRNVAFLLSDELRKQMSRVKGMKELMDGEVGSPSGLNISVICSLSMPIITICALIVLMLMVSLLNIVFFWLPFFISCFPVPTLKAKE
ncbi:MAG TPA: hypothetical protein VF584_20635 [Longimicrobium sp.]